MSGWKKVKLGFHKFGRALLSENASLIFLYTLKASIAAAYKDVSSLFFLRLTKFVLTRMYSRLEYEKFKFELLLHLLALK